MLSGIKFSGKSRRKEKEKQPYASHTSAVDDALETTKIDSLTQEPPITEARQENVSDAYSVPNPASVNSDAASNGPTRDEWMLGDFDSLFENGAVSGRRNRSRAPQPDCDAVKVYTDKELNPFFRDGGSGIPASPTDVRSGSSSGQNTPNAASYTVGDGGRHWRRKAEFRRHHTPSQESTLSDQGIGSRLKEKWESSSHWRREAATDKPSSTVVLKKTYDDTKARLQHYNFVSRAEGKSESDCASSLSSIAESGDDSVSRGSVHGKEDLHVVVNSSTLKHAVTWRTDRKASTGPKCEREKPRPDVRVLEDVDAEGRYIPAMERLDCNRSSSKRSSSENFKSGSGEEHMTIEDMYRETRVKGVEDYDRHFERLIVDRGRSRRNAEDEYDEMVHPDAYRPTANPSSKRRRGAPSNTFHQRRIRDTEALYQTESKCLFCPTSTTFPRARKDTLIAQSPHAYLCYQSFQQCVVPYHLFIAPSAHVSSSPAIDEDVYQEIRNFQKSVIRCLDAENIAVVFVECMTRTVSAEKALIGGGSHLVIDCFGIPVDRFEETKLYFRKALLDCEGDWAQHKKIIPVPKRSDGCRSSIPRNFPYFFVDFGLNGGFLHVIEDDQFPRTLGRDVIQGMMEMDSTETHFSSRTEYYSAVQRFKELFTPYNWTSMLHTE